MEKRIIALILLFLLLCIILGIALGLALQPGAILLIFSLIGVEPLPISVSGSIVYFPYSIQISNVNSTSAYISIQTLSTTMVCYL